MANRNNAYAAIILSVLCASVSIGLAGTPAASKEPSADAGSLRRLPATELTTLQVAAPQQLMQPATYQESTETTETTALAPPSITQSAISGAVSVDQLVVLARQNNPDISAARYRASSMLARVPQARAFDDPMLSTTSFLEPIQTAAGPQDVILSLSQKFPWFGKRNSRGQIAYFDAQVAFSDLADIELGVVEQVKLAFYDLYFLDESARIYLELRPRIAELIAIARRRYETNSADVGLESVLQAEVRLRELDITLVKIDQGKVKAAARLARAIHLPRGATIDIEPQLDRSLQPKQVEILVGMLDECHPRLSARREAVARDQWRVDLARRDYFPDATVGFNWAAIGERGLSAAANGRDAFSLSVGVNLPIYMDKRRAEVREARLKTGQSSQEYEAAWDALRADVEQFYADVQEQDQVLKILDEEILTRAQQTFDLSIEAYRVGRIEFQQLIDNYDTLLRLRVEYYMRVAAREQALAQLERSVGCAIAEPTVVLQQPNDQLPAPGGK